LPEEIWFYLTVIFGVAALASIVMFVMERERRKVPTQMPSSSGATWPFPTVRSIPDETVKETRDRLRILDLEREILSYAIRRLYEAHAEGKITAEERDSLAQKYREDLERIRQEIARGESIIALSELERMQEEFIKMFSEKLETLNRRIEDLRAIAGLAPPAPTPKPREEAVTQQPEKVAAPRRRKEVPKPSVPSEETRAAEVGVKGEAERRVEQIMAEVEKVLSRLSQMEVEE